MCSDDAEQATGLREEIHKKLLNKLPDTGECDEDWAPGYSKEQVCPGPRCSCPIQVYTTLWCLQAELCYKNKKVMCEPHIHVLAEILEKPILIMEQDTHVVSLHLYHPGTYQAQTYPNRKAVISLMQEDMFVFHRAKSGGGHFSAVQKKRVVTPRRKGGGSSRGDAAIYLSD